MGEDRWRIDALGCGCCRSLISILALGPVWIVFRQLRIGTPARIIALALLAINDYQVFHARYVRMYALFFLLSLASVALYNLLLEGATRKRVIALTLVNLLLVYTQYFGWMVIGIEGLHLLWMDRRKLKPFLLGTAVIALLFAPWAYTATQAAIAKGGLAPNLGWIRHPKIGDVWWYTWAAMARCGRFQWLRPWSSSCLAPWPPGFGESFAPPAPRSKPAGCASPRCWRFCRRLRLTW
jgi:hypothetical protein